MPARRLLAPLVLLAALGLAGWAGCSGDGGDGSGAGAGDAAAAGTAGALGGSGGTAGTGGSGGGGTGGSGASGGSGGGPIAACPLSGWEPMPFLGPGCASVCVPDDPATRLPKLEWTEASWCTGCQELLTPWATDLGRQTKAVGGSVRGFGSGPHIADIGLQLDSRLTGFSVWYDLAGSAIAGWHLPLGIETALSCSPFWKRLKNGLGAVHLSPEGADMLTFIAPATEPDKLMRPSAPSYTWPKSFLGTRIFQEMWYSESTLAADFRGRLAIARVGSGEPPVWADTLPGAEPGQIAEAAVAGDTVFVLHWYDFQQDACLYHNGELVPFLGGPDLMILRLATDGETIAWCEGSERYLDGTLPKFGRYDLYVAPFTTDPAQLQATKRLLVPNVATGEIVLANGFVASIYIADVDRQRRGAVVARLSDGQVWRSVQPDTSASYGSLVYPAANELWGTSSYVDPLIARTVVRVPYAAMEAQ